MIHFYFVLTEYKTNLYILLGIYDKSEEKDF